MSVSPWSKWSKSDSEGDSNTQSGGLMSSMYDLASQLASEDRKLSPLEAQSLGVDYDACMSLANHVSVRLIKSFPSRRDRNAIESAAREKASELNENVGGKSQETCLALAKKHHVSPIKFARLVVESLNKRFQFIKTFSNITDADFFQSSSILTNKLNRMGSSASASMELRIAKLHGEILTCIREESYNNYAADQLKECIGIEYEEYLIERLTDKGLCFETEADLRARGKPKTPDILFSIPVALPASAENDDEENHGLPKAIPSERQKKYNVINWIDSKAMYAEESTFKEHYDQIQGYINRYGRGLIIYWHGYASSIKQSPLFEATNQMVILTDDFPEEWLPPV